MYRRNLPHIQRDDTPHFVTFRARDNFALPKARDLAYGHCLKEHEWRAWMHGFVIMPTHVHLIFTPLRDDLGDSFTLAEIMNGIKGASAHSINKLLRRTGSLWQDESFDHVIRSENDFDDKMLYLMINPVRGQLVKNPLDYPWLWREAAQPGAAVPQNHKCSPDNPTEIAAGKVGQNTKSSRAAGNSLLRKGKPR